MTEVTAAVVDGDEHVLVRIVVEGTEPDDSASPAPMDAVLFERDDEDILINELMEREQFSGSIRLVGELDVREPEERAVWKEGRIEAALRMALGARELIATKDEIVQAILASEHLSDPGDRAELERNIELCTADGDITWKTVGTTTVAIGGSRAYKATGHDPLRKLVRRYEKAQKDPRRRSTSDAELDVGLRKLLTHKRYRRLKDTLKWEPPREAAAANASKPTRRVAKPTARQLPRSAHASPSPVKARAESSGPTSAQPVGMPASAAVGDQLRVFLDHDGFRTIAVFDPATGGVRISKGELKGYVFSDPTAAAAAVIERIAPGTPTPGDGWALWRVHDRSMTPLEDCTGRAKR